MPVFNLQVEGCPEYYANGILVHNCDCMRYAVMRADGGLGPFRISVPEDRTGGYVERLPEGVFGRRR